MTPAEFENFVAKRMSKSHIYQPAILTMLLESKGRCSAKAVAERCATITGKSASEFEKNLFKYPKEALTKGGVIKTEGKDFLLECPIDQLDDASIARLLRSTSDAMTRFAST